MAVIPTRDFKENKYLAFATAKGLIKKTEFLAYNTPIRADGIIAIKVRDGDELVQVRLTSGEDDILMVSHSGHASRFSEELVRPMGRDTSGIKGMNVAGKDNRVLAMDIARNDTELFVVTENGYGKRTPVSEYPVKGRGTKGVLTAKLTEKKGGLAGALIVGEHQELLFISQNGMVQRTSVSGISQMGRSTQGVKVMNIKDDDRVSAVALVVESDETRRRRTAAGRAPPPRTATRRQTQDEVATEPTAAPRRRSSPKLGRTSPRPHAASVASYAEQGRLAPDGRSTEVPSSCQLGTRPDWGCQFPSPTTVSGWGKYCCQAGGIFGLATWMKTVGRRRLRAFLGCIWISRGRRLPLRRLQVAQAATMFSQTDLPPRQRGMTWSTVRPDLVEPQYWQVQESRASTARRVILRRCASRGMRT